MWLCWIPIITSSVDYPRRLRGFLDKPNRERVGESCRFSMPLSDIPRDEKSQIEMTFDLGSGHVKSIKIDELIHIEVRKYFASGLVLFFFNNRFDHFGGQASAAKQVYVILKHIYHEHTHHHKDDDMLLIPEAVDDESEASIRQGIQGIVTQYTEKIISYHRSLKHPMIFSPRNADNTLTEFNKGMGEMLYAEHFVNLHGNWLEPQYCEGHTASFRSSSVSFKQMLSVFTSRLAKKNVDIAYSVIILSICIFCIGGISPFFSTEPIKNSVVYFVFIVFFLGSYWLITRPKR